MPTQSTSLPPAPGMAAAHPPLRRTRDDRIIAGVCGGLARTLGVPALAVRLVALAVAVAVTPLALIAYAGLAVAMPRDDGRALLAGEPEDRRETIIGVALIGVGLIALAAGIRSSVLGGPGGLVILAVGIVLVVVHHQRRASPPAAASPAPDPASATAPRRFVEPPYPGPARPQAAAARAGAAGTTPTMPLPAAPPAPAPPAARGPREPSVGLYGLAAVVVGSMAALVLGALGAFDASATGVALGLGLGALAMTGAAIAFARRRGAFVLIALAGLLAIGAAGTAAVGDDIDRGVGERTHLVSAPSDLSRVHRLGIGSLTVEVTRGALVAPDPTVRARLGIGELVIRVPEGVAVVATGPETPDGIDAVNAAAGPAPGRTLRVDADVDIGDLRVETTDR